MEPRLAAILAEMSLAIAPDGQGRSCNAQGLIDPRHQFLESLIAKQ